MQSNIIEQFMRFWLGRIIFCVFALGSIVALIIVCDWLGANRLGL